MHTLNFVSWNVRGLRTQEKRLNILDHLLNLGSDVCLLQETHLSHSDDHLINYGQFTKLYSSSFNSRQRGVTILIHKLPFTLNNTLTDIEGRYVIVFLTIYNKKFTIGNLYGPNKDDPEFFHSLFFSDF